MKLKNFFLIFIFGLFLLLLPSAVEAYCNATILGPFTQSGSCSIYFTGPLDPNSEPYIGIVSQYAGQYDEGLIGGELLGFCADSDGWTAQTNRIPDGYPSRLFCTVIHNEYVFPGCIHCVEPGLIDSEVAGKCVRCNYTTKTEERILGTASQVYNPCSDPPGVIGDGDCESACGADSECDERNIGASCGTGKECNGSCQCVTVCVCTSNTVGGCCDGCNYCPAGKVNNGAGTCVTPNSTYHCNSWENCDNGDCSATRRWYGCTGTSETCSASLYQEETVTASNGKVLRSDCSETSPDTSYYCDYYENCSNGDCSADEYYRACNGTGSCRTDNTYAYHVDVIASNGKVLRSDCSETSPSTSYYCDYYENCSSGDCSADKYYRACNGSGSCRTDNTYAYHVDVYASASYSLTLSCGTTGSTLCDSTWRASSGPGNNNYGDGGSDSCQGMCDGSGNCDYAVNCSGVCDCTGWVNQSCDYSTCAWYEKGRTRTCTPSGCLPELECFCDESCCSDWIDQDCGPTGGCAETEMYQTRDCGTCSYSESRCVSDPSCGGVITFNPPVVDTIADPTISEDPGNPGQYRAILTGFLDSLGYDPGICPNCKCIVWLEWGTSGTAGDSGSYGNSNTPVEMTTEDDYFYYTADNLDPGTTFKFEAFAKNGGSW